VPSDSEQPNVDRILGLLRRRGLWIVLCMAVAVIAAYGYSKHQTKKYTATASLVFNSNETSQQIAGLSASATSLAVQQANNIELLHLGDMATRTATIVGNGLTEQKVSQTLTVAGQTESSIATVSSTTTSPRLAAAIANVYAEQFVVEQGSANRHYYRSALAVVRKQLAALSPAQRVGNDGLELQDRAQSLALLAELQPNSVQVAQQASEPTAPSSPKTSRNILIAALLGLCVGVGVALLLEHLDPRIRDPSEFRSIYGLPLLGAVPASRVLVRGKRKGQDAPPRLPPAEADAFHTIRARLRSFNPEREVRTVIVASPLASEGKTTIARHLAGAAARMGAHVLLLEADFRHPELARQLNISPGVGLYEVLSGEVTTATATRLVEAQAAQGEGAQGRTFDVVLAGGTVPDNPVELLESHAMSALLAELRATYDLVVVDTPEFDSVPDAFLLTSKVDGVILVGYMNRSRRDVAQRARQVLLASGAPLVGLVANGTKRNGKTPAATGEHVGAGVQHLTTTADRSGLASSSKV
jgi:capsular exopolysaccharide synthesis family protein